MAGSAQISQLSKAVDDGKAVMENLSMSLFTMADEFDEKQRKLDIAKVSLSSTGVVGGVMTVIDLSLVPVTFGASLGLTIAGGIVGAGSAIGNISALVTDKVISKKSLENIQNLLKDFAKRTDEIQRQLGKLIGMLNAQDRVFAQTEIENCPFLTKEMKKTLISMLKGRQSERVTSQMEIAREAVGHMISASEILAKAGKAGSALNDIATGAKAVAGAANAGKSIGTAADFGTDAAATTGRVAASGVRAAGFALAGVGIAIDLGALVYYSHKIHKNEPSQLAKKIRDVAECLK